MVVELQQTLLVPHVHMRLEVAGGSGFVWSNGKERPTGYLVDEKYYLDDSGTYSKTESGFTTNPDTSGNGYVRITLIKEKIEAQKKATRWIGLPSEITFDYNGKTITEIDTENNTIKHQEINEIQYIESTGTQWIDTGIIPNQDTRLEMIAETTTDVADAANGKGFIPYGAGSSYNNNAFECYTQSSQYEFNYDGQYDFIGTAKAGEKISISHNKNVINITTGTTQYSKNFTYNAFTAPYTMVLFGINRGNILAGKARIYSCQIFSNETLVRDFIPALDKSNVPCLYDKVTKQYFYNSGTGTFNYAN